jgi:hypothetical protein
MREYVVVAETVSPEAARRLGGWLKAEGLSDVEVEAKRARVWCFFTRQVAAQDIHHRVVSAAHRTAEPTLQGSPHLRVWSEERHRYVDPATPDEDPDTRQLWVDSDLVPADVCWRVRLTLESVWDFRKVRRQLPALRRPIIANGNKHIDLGAKDRADAEQVTTHASAIDGVATVEACEIRGRLQRWLIRKRLAGNYATTTDGSGPGYGFDIGYGFDGGWGGGDGGHGGHHGGGGNGGGGHGN